jgi:hypothetical protein
VRRYVFSGVMRNDRFTFRVWGFAFPFTKRWGIAIIRDTPDPGGPR